MFSYFIVCICMVIMIFLWLETLNWVFSKWKPSLRTHHMIKKTEKGERGWRCKGECIGSCNESKRRK